MTLPAAATKVHLDSSSDDPKQARSELAALVGKFNAVLAELGGAGNPTAFNGTVGATTPASGAFTTVTAAGAVALASSLDVTGVSKLGAGAQSSTQSDAAVSVRRAGNGLEFGHGNAAGYGSVLGAFTGSGAPVLVFNGEISGNDLTTRGIRASFLRSDNAGGLIIGRSASAGTGTSAPTESVQVHASGGMTIGSPSGGSLGDGTLNAEGLFIDGVVPGSTLPAGYTSTEQTITLGGSLTLTHGLGSTPAVYGGELVCKTAEHGYSVGDRVRVSYHGVALNAGIQITATATAVKIQVGANNICVLNSSGIAAAITLANWRLVICAWI